MFGRTSWAEWPPMFLTMVPAVTQVPLVRMVNAGRPGSEFRIGDPRLRIPFAHPMAGW